MRVAVLGTGFGAHHVELYTKMPDIDKIIVWGRNETKLKNLREKFQVETTEKMEEIWENTQIDLVDICLPNHLHRDTAVRAICSGKNIFIETPVAETLEDAEAILRTAEQYGKRVFVDLFLRFEYAYEFLNDLLKKNSYGELKELRVKREPRPGGEIWTVHI